MSWVHRVLTDTDDDGRYRSGLAAILGACLVTLPLLFGMVDATTALIAMLIGSLVAVVAVPLWRSGEGALDGPMTIITYVAFLVASVVVLRQLPGLAIFGFLGGFAFTLGVLRFVNGWRNPVPPTPPDLGAPPDPARPRACARLAPTGTRHRHRHRRFARTRRVSLTMESPPPSQPWRPTRAELEAADGLAIPDVIAPGLKILFCGINPGRYSGATGRHFARPGNRFWPTLHAAGFTDRLLTPWDGEELLKAGFGITNLVNRTTATAAELGAQELREGAARLLATAERYRPACVAILGISAYRIAFDRPKAADGTAA